MTESAGRAAEETVLDALRTLGLAPDEASLYLRLSSAGPQKAGALSKALAWNRPETYRVLQRLVEQGFVDATLTRPVEFRAVAAAKLFDEVRRAQQRRLDDLEAAQVRTEQTLAELQARSASADARAPLFRILHGRTSIVATLETMIGSADASIEIACGSPFLLKALANSGVLARLAECSDSGVHVRVATAASQEIPPGPELRVGAPFAGSHAVIVDGAEALSWLHYGPTARLHEEADVALWTSAAAFVGSQRALYDAAWDCAAGR